MKLKIKNKKKQVVFFCATTPYIEIYKIAREFKKRGYQTVLITISQKDKWDRKFYEDGFDKIICSNFQIFKPTLKNLFMMIRRVPYLLKSFYEMKKLKPYVIFDIARPNYIAALFMRVFKKYPIIFSEADISSHLHPTLESALKSGKKLYEIKAERYCFENADGILIKTSPESLAHLKKDSMLGKPLSITKNILCFNPYCSDEFIKPINKNKLSKEDKGLHLVYVGSIYNAPEDLLFFIKFFKKLIDQKIHVHLYIKTHHLSVSDDQKIIKPITNYFKNNPYLHIEYAFPPKDLITEISKYDFGFWIDRVRSKDDKEHKFTMGNKFSTYLESGIAFLYSSSFEFIGSLTKKYDIDFPINTEEMESLNEIGKKLKKTNFLRLENKILKARQDFNIKKQFKRIEKFVERVVSHKNYSL